MHFQIYVNGLVFQTYQWIFTFLKMRIDNLSHPTRTFCAKMRKYDLVQSLQSDLLHKMAKTVWAYLAWSAWQSLPSSHYAKHHALSNIKHTSLYKETSQIRTSTAKMILTRATTTNTPATPIILSTAPDLKGSCWKYCFHTNKNISLSAGNSHCKQCFLNFWCWNWEGHFEEHPIWSVTGLGNQ